MDDKKQPEMMQISRKDFLLLKKLYKKSNKGEVFLFKGKEVLNDYAKYLIEYLEPLFK